MMDVGRHPNIKLLTNSEIEDISGYVGNFKARVRKKARYVDENECTSCGDCSAVCPVAVPDEYNMGLGSRKAIHIAFPQAVPSAYIVNAHECLGQNPIACGKCIEACDKKCIDFDMQDEIMDLEVGAIIVATGMDVYDPTALDEYGYTRFPNVVTSMEFERLISTGGPLEGHLGRPSDLQQPQRVGFIQCVGSRTNGSDSGNPYCSNICCMNTIKSTQYLKDNYPDIESTVFYMDLRAFGKGFEELLMRSKSNGVRYVRGLPGEVIEDSETGNLRFTVENTTGNRLETHEVDMLVLAVGATPALNTESIRQMVSLSKSPSGFLKEAHPKLKPVDTPTKGVFIAGAAESPKDVRESVTQASAAASHTSILLSKSNLNVEAITAVVDEDLCKMCGLCAPVCPYSAMTWEKKQVARVTGAACTGCGTCAAECKFEAINHAALLRPGHLRPDRCHAGRRPPGYGGHLCLQLVLLRWCRHGRGERAWPTRPTRASSAPCARGGSARSSSGMPFVKARRWCWSRAVITWTVTTSMPTAAPCVAWMGYGMAWKKLACAPTGCF